MKKKELSYNERIRRLKQAIDFMKINGYKKEMIKEYQNQIIEVVKMKQEDRILINA